jgi:hypothetical protein
MKAKVAMVTAAVFAMILGIALPDAARAEDKGNKDGKHDGLALGLGAGIVSPDGDGEIYFTANLRFRIGGDEKDDKGKRRRTKNDDGIRAYLEPEIGYWSRSGDALETKDLLLGLNLVGVVPTRAADYFFGVGFGIHSFDNNVSDPIFSDFGGSDTRLGGNFHVGLDVNLGPRIALFGVGRLDLLEGGQFDDSQSKIYGGLRFKF